MSIKKLKKLIGSSLPKSLKSKIEAYVALRRSLKPVARRTCNMCGFEGWFAGYGRPLRLDARCPNCDGLDRHRLLYLAIQKKQIPVDLETGDSKVLHFAAEPQLEHLFRKQLSHYQTADLYKEADLKLDLEQIDLADGCCNLVIANHVFEHVDDEKAANEIFRILTDNGILLVMVPIIEGWKQTYENAAVTSTADRWAHFGQGDHVRFYGRDFRDRITRSGLKLVNEITAEGKDVIKYGLVRGEKVFVFQKAGN